MTGDDAAARQLAELFSVLGPLYRRAVRLIGDDRPAGGVPVGVRAVLELLLARGPTTVPRIAGDLELSRQFVQRSVNDARERALVEARPNRRHRTSPLMALTGTGRSCIETIHAGERDAMSPVAARLDPRDVDACVRVLREVHRHLQTGLEERGIAALDAGTEGSAP